MAKKEVSKLTFVGFDDWSRALFKTGDDQLLVDVDGTLYTTTHDWGEPLHPTTMRTPPLKVKITKGV